MSGSNTNNSGIIIDEKNLGAVLKALAEELKLSRRDNRQRSLSGNQSSDLNTNDGVSSNDMRAITAFGNIQWERVNKGLNKFIGIEKNLVAAFKSFGAQHIKLASVRFAENAANISTPLGRLSDAFKNFSQISIKTVKKTLESLPVIGNLLTTGLGAFNIDTATASSNFSIVARGILEPFKEFVSFLDLISKVDKDTIQNSYAFLRTLEPLNYLITNGLGSFDSKTKKAIDRFAKYTEGLLEPIKTFISVLQAVSSLKFNITELGRFFMGLEPLNYLITNGLGSFDSKTKKSIDRFAKYTEGLLSPVRMFVKTLISISKVDNGILTGAYNFFNMLPIIGALMTEGFSEFTSKTLKSSKKFGGVIETIFTPLINFTIAISSINDRLIVTARTFFGALPEIANLLTEGFSAFTSKTIKSAKRFAKTSSIIFEPLSLFTRALGEVSRLSVISVMKSLISLPYISALLVRFLTSFGGPKLLAAGKKFTASTSDFLYPLRDFSYAINGIGEIAVGSLYKSLLFVPWMEKLLIRFMTRFGSEGLQQAGAEFALRVNIISRPIDDLSYALKSIAELPIIRATALMLALPIFIGALRLSIKLLGNTVKMIQSLESLMPVMDTLQRVGTYMTNSFATFIRTIIDRGTELIGQARTALAPLSRGIMQIVSSIFNIFGRAGKAFSALMKELAPVFASIGKTLGKIISSVFTSLSSNLKNIGKGALAITLISGALAVAALAFKQFSDVSFGALTGGILILTGITLGIVALGSQLGLVAAGALGIGLIGGALAISAIAFKQFGDIPWGDVLIGIGAIAVLALGAAGLGTIAPFVIAGSLAIGILGIALIPVAYALDLTARAMSLMNESASILIPNLISLSTIGPGLLMAASAIGVLSLALGAFTLANAGSSVLSMFTGTSMIDSIILLAKQADALERVANALDRIRSTNVEASPIQPAPLLGGVGRGQALISANEEMSANKDASAKGPIIMAPSSSPNNTRNSNVTNNVSYSGNVLPDRMAGMMPSPAYSF